MADITGGWLSVAIGHMAELSAPGDTSRVLGSRLQYNLYRINKINGYTDMREEHNACVVKPVDPHNMTNQHNNKS